MGSKPWKQGETILITHRKRFDIESGPTTGEMIVSHCVFRCTRNTYSEGCSGHSQLSARQGYYIWAACAFHALSEMQERYPTDEDGFAIQFWDTHPDWDKGQ